VRSGQWLIMYHVRGGI